MSRTTGWRRRAPRARSVATSAGARGVERSDECRRSIGSKGSRKAVRMPRLSGTAAADLEDRAVASRDVTDGRPRIRLGRARHGLAEGVEPTCTRQVQAAFPGVRRWKIGVLPADLLKNLHCRRTCRVRGIRRTDAVHLRQGFGGQSACSQCRGEGGRPSRRGASPGVPELHHERMVLECLLDDAALNAFAASVNQPHLAQACFVRGGDVLGDDRCDVARREGVEVERAFDGTFSGCGTT